VIKTILAEGQGWQTPKDADEVVVTFTARVKPAAGGAGAKSSAAEAPVVSCSPEGGATFFIGDAPCKGLAAALRSMKLHQKAMLLLSPDCEWAGYPCSPCSPPAAPLQLPPLQLPVVEIWT
jgi:hypothetical protein